MSLIAYINKCHGRRALTKNAKNASIDEKRALIRHLLDLFVHNYFLRGEISDETLQFYMVIARV